MEVGGFADEDDRDILSVVEPVKPDIVEPIDQGRVGGDGKAGNCPFS